MSDLESRFLGCLLGLAVGDAIGAPFEGQSPEAIADYFRVAGDLADIHRGVFCYTDDAQMAIGVAETLIACGQIAEEILCRQFAANYEPWRGYGPGARKVIEAIQRGDDAANVAPTTFRGGSFGNGAAMRVAPVGLMFRDDLSQLWQQAAHSARPTHVYPLGVEGAQLIAAAVGLASAKSQLDRSAFFAELTSRCSSLEYVGPLGRAAEVHDPRDLALFGNGVDAPSSVVTAIACFALTPDSYEYTIANALMLGGDIDTIAAMTGAIGGGASRRIGDSAPTDRAT